jgi:hypothetical protein
MALDGFKVLQYECVEHPKPEITESQMNNHILAVIAICPYMPTSFRDFVRYAAPDFSNITSAQCRDANVISILQGCT